jgi:phosphatidate cytidylyltransferase
MAPLQNNNRWNGLKARTTSAGLMVATLLIVLWAGGIIFTAIVLSAALFMIKEWEGLTFHDGIITQRFGYLYIILPCACLIWLRGQTNGFTVLLAFFAIISATDVAAYFAGKTFGRHKLIPAISPNKTWEGLLGGVSAAVITGLIFSLYMHLSYSYLFIGFISTVLAILAQAGDIFESFMKRKAGVKDSGNLIPGHGGILDRLDGYMFTAPVWALIVYYA